MIDPTFAVLAGFIFGALAVIIGVSIGNGVAMRSWAVGAGQLRVSNGDNEDDSR